MLEQLLKRKHIEVRHPAPGQRHNTKTIYVPHRFDVVGGISYEEWLQIEFSRESNLLQFVKRRAG